MVVFVFASAMMLANGVRQATRRAADPNGAIVLRKGCEAELESSIDESKVGAIVGAPGVARAENARPLSASELVVLVILAKTSGGFSNVVLRGVRDDVAAFRPSVKIVEGRAARPGTDEVVVGRAIRGHFERLAIGDSLELRKNRPLRVVGIFGDGGSSYESEIWADIDVVRATFREPNVVSSVRLRLVSKDAFDGLERTLEANRDLAVTVFRESDFEDKQTQGTASFLAGMGYFVGTLFSLAAIVGAMITMHAAVAERQREIGTLRALGFSPRQILASFLVESVFLSMLGGFFGAAAALSMSSRRISMLNEATWSELSFAFEPTPLILLAAFAIATLMGVIGGSLPAIRASRIHPIDAMRGF